VTEGRRREDVIAFLEAGKPKARNENPTPHPDSSSKLPEERIAVTARLPKAIAHALIDACVERRKNKEKAWWVSRSQGLVFRGVR